ncbi:DUF397 domain-containing protein [Actinocorallia aurantiaca]
MRRSRGTVRRVGVRDSKNPTGHVHTFTAATFGAFVHALRAEDRGR